MFEPASLARLPQSAFRRGKLWALSRSPSLRGLLLLPLPPETVAVARPRTAPTALPPGCDRPLPTDADDDPGHAAEPGHDGESVLALVRRGRAGGGRALIGRAEELVLAWIEEHPLASLPGWSPSLTARRIACWTQAWIEAGGDLTADGRRAWLESLYLQARYLDANLDPQPGGERIAGLRALLAAGSLLAGSEPRRWARRAAEGLPAALTAIRADGGFAGRCPVAHARVLSDLSDAAALLPPESPAAGAVRARLGDMARYAHLLAHPDGTPAGFLNPAFGQAPWLGDVLAACGYRGTRPEPVASFEKSGFSALRRSADGDALLVDWRGAAAGGAFSLEASFGGDRWLVTPRVDEQTASGRAHNAIVADGRGLTAAGRELKEVIWGDGPGYAYLGLKLANGPHTHQRRVLALSSRAVLVIDRVEGVERAAEAQLHLAPGVGVAAGGDRQLFLERGDETVTLAWIPGLRAAARHATVTGVDGASVPINALRLWTPGGGPRALGFLLVAGRRRDAALDLLERGDGERIAARFDPRRYLIRWDPHAAPRLELAD